MELGQVLPTLEMHTRADLALAQILKDRDKTSAEEIVESLETAARTRSNASAG